jgi:chromosome segregation ATPase
MKTFSFHTRPFVFCLCFLPAVCFAGLAYGQQTGIGQPNAAQSSTGQDDLSRQILAAQNTVYQDQQVIAATLALLSNDKQDLDALKKELHATRLGLDDLNKQLQSAQAAHNQKAVADLQTKITTTQARINDLLTNLIPKNQQKIAKEQDDLNNAQHKLQRDQDALNKLRSAALASGKLTPADNKREDTTPGAKATPGTRTTPASGLTVDKATTGQRGAGPPAAGAGLPQDD